MPRSSIPRVFKKRKGTKKRRIEEESSVSPINIPSSPTARPSRSPSESSSSSRSSSVSKLEGFEKKYADYEESSSRYDIVNLSEFFNHLKETFNITCKKCNGPISLGINRRVGLAAEVFSLCVACNDGTHFWTSKKITVEEKPKKLYEINTRLVYALRAIGKGKFAGRIFCALMNLPPPTTRFYTIENALTTAVQKQCTISMKESVEEAVEANEGVREIPIALDGTWQKRGHTSLNGVVTATSVDNGKVIDVEVLSKHCRCPGSTSNIHIENCAANYQGVSGGMEVQGVVNIFKRSEELHKVKYSSYLGDGDSKGHKAVVQAQVYGPNYEIKKLECVGHVQKRMGTRLRALKQHTKHRLSDQKFLGGKNRLSDGNIDKIQKYYGNAIRRNQGNLEEMKKDVWAEFFHLASSNEQPHHGLCPGGENGWCKFRKAEAKGLPYDHKSHFHLPLPIMEAIKPISRDLAHPDLLRECLHGGTQNPNESVNNIIWSRIPKNTFVGLKTLQLGVYDAVGCFNIGSILRCKVYKDLGIDPGYFCVDALKKIDAERLSTAMKSLSDLQQKARQKRTQACRKLEEEFQSAEDPDDPSYGAGMH